VRSGSKKGLQSAGKEEVKVLLKPRTLQVLTGEARYDYTHGISHGDLLDEERISVTMRMSPVTRKGAA
jgi:hypothetical protein